MHTLPRHAKYLTPLLALIITGLIGLTIALISLTPKFEKRNEVSQTCTNLEFESWVNCIANIAVEKNSASYCWNAGSIFSPWPSQCMNIFAQEVKTQEACTTIFKPEIRNSCLQRLNAL